MFINTSSHIKSARFSFRPDFIAEAVQAIDFAYLKAMGITTVFLDLDGTVVDRGRYDIDESLLKVLHSSALDIIIATNRPRSRSLKDLREKLHARAVIHPWGIFGKPTRTYYKHALKEYGLQPHQVVMIGDRFIQDILGANCSGIYSLLVYKFGANKNPADAIISRGEKLYTGRLVKNYKKL